MVSTNITTAPPQPTTGLRYWMEQVLQQCARAERDLAPDPVHDLRVALRRCRSLADGMIALDSSPEWKKMKKAGRKLFQSLGQLRDLHVMIEWVEKLSPAALPQSRAILDAPGPVETVDRDPAALALLTAFASLEQEHRNVARTALQTFDRKQWRQWSRGLPARAAHFRPGSPLFRHLALERWTEARELHRRALHNRSQTAFHELRVGVKRFRYIVENFLPAPHEDWGADLKQIQDVLGDVHDLDVLWATASGMNVFPSADSRRAWQLLIAEKRKRRLDLYHEKMVGPDSLWIRWRAGLPQGAEVREIAIRRLRVWARGLDPDFVHSQCVARLALELFDGLCARNLFAVDNTRDLRSSLLLAALLHDVGKSQGEKSHHKRSEELILAHGIPLGCSEEEIRRAALVARFHAGALPTRRHKALRDLLPDQQRVVIELTAVLRLANALDVTHDGHVRRIQVRFEEGNSVPRGDRSYVIVAAEGYSAHSATAQAAAAERYLLETVVHRPVLVRPLLPSRLPAKRGS